MIGFTYNGVQIRLDVTLPRETWVGYDEKARAICFSAGRVEMWAGKCGTVRRMKVGPGVWERIRELAGAK